MTDAAALGIETEYEVIGGKTQRVPDETVRALAGVLGGGVPLRADPDPGEAYAPDALAGPGLWGVAVQLYAVRSQRNWGIGDFTDLAGIVRWARSLGADYVGVNPLHALPYAEPARRSPYYPSSRLFLNVWMIDPDAAARDLNVALPQDEDALAAARAGDLLDYEAAARAKAPAFEALWAGFADAPQDRRDAFANFRTERGEALARHALFEALAEHLAPDHGAGFPGWPEAYRTPDTDEVRRFAETHADRVSFHAFLQWLAHEQLRAAADAAPGTSLYLDLAVGAAPDGAEVWAGGDLFARGVRLGAPPDPMAMQGQDWGLPPLNPAVLAERDFAPLRAILAASMAYAGALRIDHVLGFHRQFWIPDGRSAAEGGYVRFPRAGMIAAAAAASRDHDCLVVGEDLGTVPEGLTEALHAARILSYEVARWARLKDGSFMAGPDYPRLCLAVASTHDVAPIPGWLAGRDLRDRAEAEGWTDDHLAGARKERAAERDGLLTLWGVSDEAPPETVVLAAHRFLAASKAGVVLAALEDVLLQEEQVNMPGTTDEYPNWRVRYARDLEDWTQDEGAAALARAAAR